MRFGGLAWLETAVYSGGEPLEGVAGGVAASWQPFDLAAAGEMSRLELLLAAVCRFLNTGGGWAQFDAAVSALKADFPGGRDLGPYTYLSGRVTDDGTVEHTFLHGDGLGGLRWVEGLYVDRLPAEKILEEFGRDADPAPEAEPDGGPVPGVLPGDGLPAP
jgi:hypothetical protein